MIYRMKNELERTPIEGCMGGNGTVTHEGEMETMVIVRGKAVHTINGQDQYLEEGDIIAAQPGDSHGIAQTGDEPLVLIAQVLFA